MRKDALLSEDGVYRWWLSREWSILNPKRCTFVMLNPSTADAYEDDATIARCIGFSKKFGYGGMVVVNLYALRSRDPEALHSHEDPVGNANNFWLRNAIEHANGCVIAAWGTKGGDRAQVIRDRYKGKLSCLKITKDGHPQHPLYLPTDSEVIPYV